MLTDARYTRLKASILAYTIPCGQLLQCNVVDLRGELKYGVNCHIFTTTLYKKKYNKATTKSSTKVFIKNLLSFSSRFKFKKIQISSKDLKKINGESS